MRIVTKHTHNRLSKGIINSFYHHIVLFEPSLKIDKISLEFGDKETVLDGSEATIKIDLADPVFQDRDVINPYVCQEIIRLTIKNELPKFFEDIICGRKTAVIYPRGYFQLCYLELMKFKRIKHLQRFLDANKHWIIFYPVDSYNSDFLKRVTDKIHHDRKLEVLCRPLFTASKNSLLSNENLKKSAAAYKNLSEQHAGN